METTPRYAPLSELGIFVLGDGLYGIEGTGETMSRQDLIQLLEADVAILYPNIHELDIAQAEDLPTLVLLDKIDIAYRKKELLTQAGTADTGKIMVPVVRKKQLLSPERKIFIANILLPGRGYYYVKMVAYGWIYALSLAVLGYCAVLITGSVLTSLIFLSVINLMVSLNLYKKKIAIDNFGFQAADNTMQPLMLFVPISFIVLQLVNTFLLNGRMFIICQGYYYLGMNWVWNLAFKHPFYTRSGPIDIGNLIYPSIGIFIVYLLACLTISAIMLFLVGLFKKRMLRTMEER
jgi:hypothetical protein